MVVLLASDPFWESLLRQEGVGYRPIESGGLKSGEIAVAPAGIAPAAAEQLRRFLAAGGFAIADADAIAAQEGRGRCLVLRFNLAAKLAGFRTAERLFPARAPRWPFETVSRVDRGGVRRRIADAMRRFCWQQGQPYVHLSYAPSSVAPGFGLRVDTDSGSRSALRAAARLARDRQMRFTWFINTGSEPDLGGLTRELAGQDIQLHCHRHQVAPDSAANRANFGQGLGILRRAGVRPEGVAAPYGDWTPDLSRVFAALGFAYSSEFGYAYDDLPGRPVICGQPAEVLQVPVHPISLGRLVWARATTGQMGDYYRQVIGRQRARLEPCFLYDHPETMERFHDAIAEVLQYGRETCGGELNLTDYACWWLKREQARFAIAVGDAETVVSATAAGHDLSLTLEWPERYAVVPLALGLLRHSALDWQARPKPAPVGFGPGAGFSQRLLLPLRAALRRRQKGLQIRRRSL